MATALHRVAKSAEPRAWKGHPRLAQLAGRVHGARKGTNGVSGALQKSCILTGTSWVLLLTYFYLPKSARAYPFPQSGKTHCFCSGPVSVDPLRPQSRRARRRRSLEEAAAHRQRRAGGLAAGAEGPARPRLPPPWVMETGLDFNVFLQDFR